MTDIHDLEYVDVYGTDAGNRKEKVVLAIREFPGEDRPLQIEGAFRTRRGVRDHKKLHGDPNKPGFLHFVSIPVKDTVTFTDIFERPSKPEWNMLVVMVGPPGCGKSHIARKAAASVPDFEVISTDAIRKELNGDEADQANGDEVFALAYSRMQTAGLAGKSVVFDACNCTPRTRHEILEASSGYFDRYITAVFTGGIETCFNNNANRTRHVPQEVIMRMMSHLRETPPSTTEGWDYVIRMNDLERFLSLAYISER